MATPQQRESWKLIGRTEESIFQNAFADKQRAVFFDIHQKESRGEPLTQTELHIKAVGFSQAPEFVRDIGFAALGAGVIGAKGFAGKAGLRGAKVGMRKTKAPVTTPKPANFSRELCPEDLGIKGHLKELRGKFSMTDKAAILKIEGTIANTDLLRMCATITDRA